MGNPSPYRSFEDAVAAVNGLTEIAQRATLTASGDAELVDVLGALKEQSAGIMSVRKGATAELDPKDAPSGATFEIVAQGEYVKSYNHSGLLLRFAEAMGVSPLAALSRLLRSGVVRLDWQFRKLEVEAREWGIDLPTTNHDITDDDPTFMIGKRWKDNNPTFQRKEDDGD